MLISVDKKFSNEVCKHWGIIDAGTVLLIRQSYEENEIKYVIPKAPCPYLHGHDIVFPRLQAKFIRFQKSWPKAGSL